MRRSLWEDNFSGYYERRLKEIEHKVREKVSFGSVESIVEGMIR